LSVVDFPGLSKAWIGLLRDVSLARHYKLVGGGVGRGLGSPNPLLETLLPALLYIRLASVLDEVLEAYIELHSLVPPRGYRPDLNGRITFLTDLGFLADSAALHSVREKRNDVAHQYGSTTWSELDEGIRIVEQEATHMGFNVPMPEYEFVFEASELEGSDDPAIAFSRRYSYGLTEGGKKVVEVSWTENVYND
jgi:hypothetical protein